VSRTDDKKKWLEALYEEVRRCSKCQIAMLPPNADRPEGSGDVDAEVMLVGTAPSWYRNPLRRIVYTGVFSSDSPLDELLYEGLKTIGLSREMVFCTNVLKCSTPENRNPLDLELKRCGKFLLREIGIVSPKLVIAMGRVASDFLLDSWKTVNVKKKIDGRTYASVVHPAFALRIRKPEMFIEQLRQVYLKYKNGDAEWYGGE
jgi:DNA polymerase